ncbi:hypothetical protein [Aeromonas dhakensis]|uniref:hypothetical protein n=1 Tax=Aeromonas dhakensis TaxID=196024 RepID=UPI0012FD1B69|nr:hypothetical protein [Aeromonas dhakensis]
MYELKKKVGRKPQVTKDMAAEFKRLNDLGYSMESIGKTHHLTHATVSRAIKRLKEGLFD